MISNVIQLKTKGGNRTEDQQVSQSAVQEILRMVSLNIHMVELTM